MIYDMICWCQVIGVNLTTDPEQRVELEFGKDVDIEFSYAVQWVRVDVPYVDRYFYHHKNNIGDQSVEIHWLSILNSFVLVILLMSLLAIILVHVLKKVQTIPHHPTSNLQPPLRSNLT